MKSLSPKKYIETRARSLPLYKCMINRDWEEAQMAEVIVMRRHSNGNVTTGIYLVDLLCLGIKDTFFYFNEAEEDALKRVDFLKILMDIDYDLAHNIIYAGYEFAMEFGIRPHADFALTKYILEEDNDNVPLIDIPVGDKNDGKPHLMITVAGSFSDALKKLQKNAGEGNYYYTPYSSSLNDLAEEELFEEEIDDYEEEEPDFTLLSDEVTEDIDAEDVEVTEVEVIKDEEKKEE